MKNGSRDKYKASACPSFPTLNPIKFMGLGTEILDGKSNSLTALDVRSFSQSTSKGCRAGTDASLLRGRKVVTGGKAGTLSDLHRADAAFKQDVEGLIEVPPCLAEEHLRLLGSLIDWDEHFEDLEPYSKLRRVLTPEGAYIEPSWPHSSGSRPRSLSTESIASVSSASRHNVTPLPSTELLPSRLAVAEPVSLAVAVRQYYEVSLSQALSTPGSPTSTSTSTDILTTTSSSQASLPRVVLWEIEALEDPAPKAPVTKENLKELDLSSIQNTINLRYDLCFDQDLFFQRVSGSKGIEKKTKATIFYRYMCLELRTVAHNLQGQCVSCQESKLPRYTMQSRLASYFTSLRDLLDILVPEAEKDVVREVMDPQWLTRRVRVGSFDAVEFSAWLHKLLTRHCAPMRDEMAREMKEKISNGASTGDMNLLTDGMETLLNLLENMKIDIANHQIRTFKLLLIADTVPFLRDCFRKMYNSNRIALRPSRKWFEELRHSGSCASMTVFESFIYGFVRLCCVPEDSFTLPTTFNWDSDRITQVRNEIFDHTHLDICMSLYKDRCVSTPPSTVQELELKDRLIRLISDLEGASEGVRQHIEEVDCEISRAVDSTLLGGSRPESQRKGLSSYNKVASTDPSKNHKKHNKGRFAQNTISKSLKSALDATETTNLDTLSEKIFDETSKIAHKFLKMETLQISNYQRSRSELRTTQNTGSHFPDITEIASKLAHIGVVHWQVWADLVYLDGTWTTTTPNLKPVRSS